MPFRGINFEFQAGELVLCFEPDPTMARVLYDAKILEPSVSRDAKGRRRPEYHIHFLGWKTSWDRIVPESYVLKWNDETKAMQLKLAEIARHVKNNKQRKRKIDDILRGYFGGRIPLDSSSDEESEETSDTDTEAENECEANFLGDDGFYGDDDDDEIKFKQKPKIKNGNKFRRHLGGKRGGMDGQVDDTETDTETEDEAVAEEEEQQVYNDGLEIKEIKPVELDMPKVLQQKLEDDCYFINRKKKLVKLPAEPNVITVLESHVKNMAINVLCATVEKLRPREAYPPPEKNIEMCKEVMDGLRVIFDFSLGANLLYEVEKAQHRKIMSTFHPVGGVKRESLNTAEQMALHSPRLRSSSRRGSPAHGGEPSPKIPRLSPKIKPDEEELVIGTLTFLDAKEEESDSESSEDEEETPSRRMTRHAYAEEIRKSKSSRKSAPDNVDHPSPELNTSTRKSAGTHKSTKENTGTSHGESNRRGSLRSSRHHSGTSQHSLDVPLPPVHKGQTLSDRVTPPPPILIPNQISSTTNTKGCQTPTRSKCSTPTMNDQTLAEKEGVLNSVLSWKLIPDEVYSGTPTPPCVIYGSQHLLRMFVKIPSLLGRMPIPDSRLKALVKHLNMFLQYVADRSDELFPESAYVDASEAMNSIKQLSVKR